LVSARLALGIAEAPAYPCNSRILNTWFPQHERARAVIVGGVLSDYLLRRIGSANIARKLPIVTGLAMCAELKSNLRLPQFRASRAGCGRVWLRVLRRRPWRTRG
jgi:hypothetical protein